LIGIEEKADAGGCGIECGWHECNPQGEGSVGVFDTGAYDIRLASTYVLGWIGDGAWQARARDWAGERGE
jgi:hypothetical protein